MLGLKMSVQVSSVEICLMPVSKVGAFFLNFAPNISMSNPETKKKNVSPQRSAST